MTQDQWLRIKNVIAEVEAETVSDVVVSAEDRGIAAATRGIARALRDLRCKYGDSTPEAAALRLAVDTAERWTP